MAAQLGGQGPDEGDGTLIQRKVDGRDRQRPLQRGSATTDLLTEVRIPRSREPLNQSKAIALTFDQFKYGWANNLDDTEAHELYETFHVPRRALPCFRGPSPT
jgi:hypothetical protein